MARANYAKHGKIDCMSDAASIKDGSLPEDPAALRAFALALMERCAKLERLLKLANSAQYGKSSEKLSPDQLQLALEDIEQAVAETQAQEEKSDAAARTPRVAERRANRGHLPEHLPRIIETLAPKETQCPCCAGALVEIGADESERLDVVPAKLQVIVTRRPKLVCRACPGIIVQHPAPERLIKGGLPTEALVAHVIESGLRGRSADERRDGRQKLARPLIESFKTWCENQLSCLSGKSDTAGAIRYALNHWDGLVRYLEDGRIEMDTNAVERAMRPIKLTAKNALFAGCDDGADHWAMLASLIETCKLNGVDAQSWLTDVLTKLVDNWPMSGLDELLPWAPAYQTPHVVLERAA